MSAEYMHIGIPITNKKPGMTYNEGAKFWVSNVDDYDYKIEYLKFEDLVENAFGQTVEFTVSSPDINTGQDKRNDDHANAERDPAGDAGSGVQRGAEPAGCKGDKQNKAHVDH